MVRPRDILRILSTPCSEATQLISRAEDEPLEWPLRAAIRVHTLYCSKCRLFRRQLRVLRSALSGLANAEQGGDETRLSPEARERIGNALHSSGEPGS